MRANKRRQADVNVQCFGEPVSEFCDRSVAELEDLAGGAVCPGLDVAEGGQLSAAAARG